MTGTAVVTGASGGIGAAVVRVLAGRGDRVLAVGRNRARLDALCRTVPGVAPVTLDLRDLADLPRALLELKHIDVLAHCAGVAEVAGVAETPYPVWRETLLVNVTAAAELTRATLPALRRAAGHVVFINAAPRMRAVPRWSAYAASKVALRELADSLRTEEAGHGVRVTTIYAGGTATDLLQKVRAQFGRPFDPAQCLQPATGSTTILNQEPCSRPTPRAGPPRGWWWTVSGADTSATPASPRAPAPGPSPSLWTRLVGSPM